MKKIYALEFTLIILSILLGVRTGSAQCTATYSTQNNFCDLDSLYLTVYPTGGTEPYEFLWETEETTQTISIPLATGDYSVTITDADGCVFVLNCHIKPGPLVLFYPFNQNACEGDTVTLFLDWYRDSIPGATYLWSTGETTPTIQITDDIVWSVTVTDPSTGCEFIVPPNLFDFHPTPYPEIVGPTMLCEGQTAILSVEGGPFGTIVWYEEGIWEGTYSETFEVDHPATYIVWGSSTEADYCWHQDTITIVAGEIDPPVLEGPPSLCAGQAGTINITNSSAYVEFIWSNGETTSSINVNQPGTYTVTVTNAGGCTETGSITIGNGSDIDINLTPDASTCGESNGSLDLSISPPGTYTYQWSNGSTSEDLTDVLSGSYQVTVTSSGGCTAVLSAFIPDNPILITINEVIVPNTSCEEGNGAIDISLFPSGTYNIIWSNGASTEDLTNLDPGSYTITVTLGENCTASDTYLIENNIDAPIIVANAIPATCGEENGAIELNVSGGVPPYTFIWSNGSTSEDLTNLFGGTYTVTVTGENGCAESEMIQVPDDDISVTLTADIIPVTSCVESNGSIDLTVSPDGTYTFFWSNGATTEDLSNISDGIYTVEVFFGESCSDTATFIVSHEGSDVQLSAVVTQNNSCEFPDGSIDLTLTPEDTYTFLWSNGETTEDVIDLSAGSYTVTITDINSCTYFGSYAIENTLTIPSITPIITAASCGNNNGAIDLTIVPDLGNTYMWSNGASTEDLIDLAPGLYMVTVTGSNGCTAIDSISVNGSISDFSLTASSAPNTSCSSPNGSIDLTVSPAGTYSFAWSNGATSEDLTGLSQGTYAVTVTDEGGCISDTLFNVGTTTPGPVFTNQIVAATCGSMNGSIDLAMGSPGSYVFIWSNGASTEDLSAIGPGNYSVTVTNASGCSTVESFIVPNINSNFTVSSSSAPNTSCTIANGSIDISATPAGSYTFLWSNGMQTEDLQNLAQGDYIVTVTDGLGCSIIDTITIGNATVLPVINAQVVPETCGQGNGAIDLTVTPANGNIFAWSHGAGTEDISALAGGTYSVTVTNSNGCTAEAVFTIQEISSNFSLNAVTGPLNSCLSLNGTIDLQITPAGIYNYIWSNGAIAEDLQNLGAGSYAVTVTDNLNCSSTASFEIPDERIVPVIDQIVTPASCGQPVGAIELTVTPGTGNAFIWSNGATSQNLENLSIGIFSVTVTTAQGCTASASFEIADTTSEFTVSGIASPNTSCIINNGSLDITVSPSGFYSFLWSNGMTTEDIGNLNPGTYIVTITNAANCINTQSFLIQDQTTPPVVTYTISPVTCGENNGSVDLTITPPAGNIILWSNGHNVEDMSGLASGNYSVTITNADGCTWSEQFNIPASIIPIVDLGADLIVESGQEVTIKAIVNVPVSALDTTIWLPAGMFSCEQAICLEQTFTPTESMEVIFMVFDTSGCMAEESVMIQVRSLIDPVVFIPNVFSPNGDNINDAFTIFANPDVEEVVDLRIFDRWGEFVFQNQHFPPNQPVYGWDGMYRSKLMDPAVFVYWTKVRFTDGTEQLYKGDVTLVR